jgi:hypothetical protein
VRLFEGLGKNEWGSKRADAGMHARGAPRTEAKCWYNLVNKSSETD